MEINTRNTIKTKTIVSQDEDDNIFRTPRQSISSDRNDVISVKDRQPDSKNEMKDDQEESEKNKTITDENEEDEDTNWDEATNSRRSNCGRNIA